MSRTTKEDPTIIARTTRATKTLCKTLPTQFPSRNCPRLDKRSPIYTEIYTVLLPLTASRERRTFCRNTKTTRAIFLEPVRESLAESRRVFLRNIGRLNDSKGSFAACKLVDCSQEKRCNCLDKTRSCHM